MGNLFKFLPLIMRLIPLIPQLIDALRSGKIVEFLRGQGGELWEILLAIGREFWPDLSPEEQVAAATLKTFDQSTVKVVQGGLNRLGQKPALVVDGDYGQKTKDAVKAFQTKMKIDADGWAGPETQTALQVEINKLPKAPVPQ